jgi:HTH-type transcriptional regulator, competence development regulator
MGKNNRLYEYGKCMRKWRKAKKLSIREVAKQCGLTPNSIALIENGGFAGSEDVLRKLSLLYGIELDALMVAAQKVPSDIEKILLEVPHSFAFLRLASKERWSLDPAQWTTRLE